MRKLPPNPKTNSPDLDEVLEAYDIKKWATNVESARTQAKSQILATHIPKADVVKALGEDVPYKVPKSKANHWGLTEDGIGRQIHNMKEAGKTELRHSIKSNLGINDD